MTQVVTDKLREYVSHPFRALITANGVQYAGQANMAADGAWTTVNAVQFNAVPQTKGIEGYGTLKEVLVGWTVTCKSDNGDCVINFQVQGRDLINTSRTPSWVTISDSVTQTRPVNAGWQEKTISGYAVLQTNFNTYPFELRMQMKANTAANVEAKMKNSSYTVYKYLIN